MSTFDKVKAITVEQLSVDADDVKMESTFIDDLGADSLDIVELIMQQHCGEHILSYAFWKECGANNIGFHMNNDVVTIDLDKELTEEDMLKAETFANAELWADKPVHVYRRHRNLYRLLWRVRSGTRIK